MRRNMNQSASNLLLGISIVVGAIGCAPARYYGGDTFEQTVIARGERDVLLSHLETRLPESGVSRLSLASGGQLVEVKEGDFASASAGTDASKRATLGSFSTPALAALRIGLDNKTRGAELDLLVETSADSVVPVTVLHEPDGSLFIRQGAPRPSRRPDAPIVAPSPEEMKARYGIGPSDFGQVEWTPEYLVVLDKALALLSPEERAFLSKVPIVREHRPSKVFVHPQFQEHVQALYTQRLGVARVELYDSLLDDDQRLFVGSPDAPLPRSVMYLIHEFGHVIASASRASVLRDLTQSLDSYYDRFDELVEQNTDENGKVYVTTEEYNDLNKKYWNIETTFDRLDRLGRRGPVIAAYRSARGNRKGPTPYGALSLHESFAEAFAMFRADPEALRRVDASAHRFFERGAHMKALAE